MVRAEHSEFAGNYTRERREKQYHRRDTEFAEKMPSLGVLGASAVNSPNSSLQQQHTVHSSGLKSSIP